ncbi:MAG: MCP four helix bundle domain-containing protein [Fibrobacteres bacterium]|nr:MCP four helix bundle domain-containing protein [Fibrobacterota bacterium]
MGFSAVLVIASALGAFAYSRLIKIGGNASFITTDCMPGVFLAEEIQKKAQTLLLLPAKHILAQDKADMEAIEEQTRVLKGDIDKILKDYEATITTQEDRDLFAKIAPARERFINIRNQSVLPASRLGKKAEAQAAFKSQLEPAFVEYAKACQAVVDMNKRNADEAGVSIMGAVSAAKSGILFGLLAALSVGAAIGIFLSRSISSALSQVITTLSSGSEQVASASNQVSQSSQQMAEGASEQASSLEETSASLEEMSSMTKQNSENSRQANAMALETRSAVERSREAMTRMGDAINKIKGSSDQTAKIIKTIDEIAFQTNLLALNAAVEAARAGDAGKGFAVVAEEVRNIAQRSAEAAKNTAALIEESQQNANNGVAVSSEVGGILSQIVESVQKLAHLIGEVSAASDEQSKGIEQIGTAVTQMDKLTQSNAANAEESASASEELAAQAKELGDMVQVLVGIVKGAGAQNASSQGLASASYAASRLPRAAAPMAASHQSAKPALKPRGDWAAVGHGKPAPARSNGKPSHAVAANGHSVRPEQVIPMDDADLKDF